MYRWLSVLLVGASCAGELDDEFRARAGLPLSYCDDPALIFEKLIKPTCVLSGCHNASSHAQALDLEGPGAAERMRGAASTCNGEVLVDADSAGYFLDKISLDAPSCGVRMPLGKAALNMAQLECVKTWLRAP